jgi:hypothetical protein
VNQVEPGMDGAFRLDLEAGVSKVAGPVDRVLDPDPVLDLGIVAALEGKLEAHARHRLPGVGHGMAVGQPLGKPGARLRGILEERREKQYREVHISINDARDARVTVRREG